MIGAFLSQIGVKLWPNSSVSFFLLPASVSLILSIANTGFIAAFCPETLPKSKRVSCQWIQCFSSFFKSKRNIILLIFISKGFTSNDVERCFEFDRSDSFVPIQRLGKNPKIKRFETKMLKWNVTLWIDWWWLNEVMLIGRSCWVELIQMMIIEEFLHISQNDFLHELSNNGNRVRIFIVLEQSVICLRREIENWLWGHSMTEAFCVPWILISLSLYLEKHRTSEISFRISEISILRSLGLASFFYMIIFTGLEFTITFLVYNRFNWNRFERKETWRRKFDSAFQFGPRKNVFPDGFVDGSDSGWLRSSNRSRKRNSSVDSSEFGYFYFSRWNTKKKNISNARRRKLIRRKRRFVEIHNDFVVLDQLSLFDFSVGPKKGANGNLFFLFDSKHDENDEKQQEKCADARRNFRGQRKSKFFRGAKFSMNFRPEVFCLRTGKSESWIFFRQRENSERRRQNSVGLDFSQRIPGQIENLKVKTTNSVRFDDFDSVRR